MTTNFRRLPLSIGVASIALAAACDDRSPPPEFRDIKPVCVEDEGAAEGEWTCPESLKIDCTETPPAEIYVVRDGSGQSCSKEGYQTIDGPFPPGKHQIMVTDRADGEAVCQSRLTVIDDDPPVVETREIELWPPNHKMVEVRLTDCFRQVADCDDDWTARITWASSDEPPNAHGDGNTDPDIEFVAVDVIALRRERAGGGNGRVYEIGFIVEDGSGNEAEGQCRVSVPHDQRGHAVDDGPDRRLVAPGFGPDGDIDD